MAIDVNKVYTTVLSILNKKGSGYMTPDNFNKIAKVVQLELLDRAFYEYNRAIAKQTSGRGSQGYGDIPRKIMDKLDPFCSVITLNSATGFFEPPGFDSNSTYPGNDLYATLSLKVSEKFVDIERIDKSKLPFLFSSKLTAPSTIFPVYYYSADLLYVFPNTITSVDLYYVSKPADPMWNSSVDTSSFGTPIYSYNDLDSINFTLHASDESDLILGILKYFGVTIKDPLVIQATQQEEQSITQQEQ
tara:strand:- start:3457 stop:4194 length:738 start_codon:yes stop_codon:yes gene_type:complete